MGAEGWLHAAALNLICEQIGRWHDAGSTRPRSADPDQTPTVDIYLQAGLLGRLPCLPRPRTDPGGPVDIRSAQKLTWENKVAKGFNTSEIPLEFCLMQGEITEAFDAWRRQRDDLDEELADVALFLLSLAEMTGVDLQAAVENKISKNAARVYIPDQKSGTLTRVDADHSTPPHQSGNSSS